MTFQTFSDLDDTFEATPSKIISNLGNIRVITTDQTHPSNFLLLMLLEFYQRKESSSHLLPQNLI